MFRMGVCGVGFVLTVCRVCFFPDWHGHPPPALLHRFIPGCVERGPVPFCVKVMYEYQLKDCVTCCGDGYRWVFPLFEIDFGGWVRA